MKFALGFLIGGTWIFSSCALRWSLSQSPQNEQELPLYLAQVVDYGDYGGLAGRTQKALAQKLIASRRFQLVPLEEAKWALRVVVRRQKFFTTAVSDCRRKDVTSTLGAGAFACDSLAQKDPHLPDISAEKEQMTLSARIEIMALPSGQLVKAQELKSLSSGEYELVGPKEVQAQLTGLPEIHSLRYLEQREKATENLALQIAQQAVVLSQGIDGATF